jgi:hypothetical protein
VFEPPHLDSYIDELNSSRKNMAVDSVNYLCVPFAEHLEQPASVVQCVNRVSLIRCFDGIFEPVRDAWIIKDFVESHNQPYCGHYI